MVYYKSYFKYISPITNEISSGYVYAMCQKDDPVAIHAYFKVANEGSISWAITEITETEFKKGPLKHENHLIVYLNKNFKEKIFNG